MGPRTENRAEHKRFKKAWRKKSERVWQMRKRQVVNRSRDVIDNKKLYKNPSTRPLKFSVFYPNRSSVFT
jgi:hypothetical protein